MKLALFDDFVPGVVRADEIVSIEPVLKPLQAASPQELMERMIARWDEYRPQIERHVEGARAVPVSSVRLRPPLPRPSKIICAAANYMEGIEGNVSELDFFHKSPSAIIGDGDTMVLPPTEVTIFHH